MAERLCSDSLRMQPAGRRNAAGVPPLRVESYLMRYAICNETFQNWDWGAVCRQTAALGYDGIEIAPFTFSPDARLLTAAQRAEIRQTAQNAGLTITGLHWLLVSPKGLSITTRDQKVRLETSDYLAALVELCADLGGRTLILGSPGQRRIPDGDTASDAEERLIECLQPAVTLAVQEDITLCLEPLPPPEADFLLTLEHAVALAQRFASPAVKTIFDVKSASSEDRPLPDLIRAYAPWIAHVHANDANRRGPGFGDTDFVPVLSALDEIDYAGWVSIEVFDYSPDPVTIARDGLAYLKRCAARQGETNR